MAYYVSFDFEGRALQSGYCLDGAEDAQCPGAVTTVIAAVLVDVAALRFDGADVVAIPTRPSEVHEWDAWLASWVITTQGLDVLRSARRAEIDGIRDAKRWAPLDYQGVLFDADPASVANIQGLSTRIVRGDGLTAGWAGWRTFDNAMVWCDATPAEVLADLNAISCTLENRQQALLLRAWSLKAAIEACATAGEILALDITAGWPV